MKRVICFILLISCLGINFDALAADTADRAIFSTDNVIVSNSDHEFFVDIIITNDYLYSSAEFGLKLEGNIEIKSIVYNEAITGSKVNVFKKNDVYFFGFFDDQNNYNGNINICTLGFGYTGRQPAKVNMVDANIFSITSTGGTTKENISSGQSVSVTRAVDNGTSNAGNSDTPGNNEQNQEVVIPEDDIPGVPGYVVKETFTKEFSAKVFKTGETVNMTFDTPAASITFSTDIFPTDVLKDAQKVEFIISVIDTTKLQEELQERFSGRPLLHIGVAIDGVNTEWKNKAPAYISIPYKPSQEEQKNPHSIVACSIDSNNKFNVVRNGKYGPETETVSFSVTQFSLCGVAFVHKTFEDIKTSWARKQIEALAARGIINGTSPKTYSPDVKITRADFITLLIGVLDKPDAKLQEEFRDVSPQDYFYNAVNTAKALGITSGVGDNSFNPKGYITRQDMMVLIDKTLAMSGVSLEETSDLSDFSDSGSVADYARISVGKLVAADIIKGYEGKIRPGDSLTRAEGATVLYLIHDLIVSNR